MFANLPRELVFYIFSFITQPMALMEDIRHYVSSRSLIQEIYMNRYACKYPDAENEWLSNDLLIFYNKTMVVSEHFLNILRRLFPLRDKFRNMVGLSLGFVHRKIKGTCKSKNNIILALLTVEEREYFINNFHL